MSFYKSALLVEMNMGSLNVWNSKKENREMNVITFSCYISYAVNLALY